MKLSYKQIIESLYIFENFLSFEAPILIDSTVSNFRYMNNNSEALPNSINESLGFVESLGENPTEKLSSKQTKKIPLYCDESPSTQIKLNIKTFFIKEFKEVFNELTVQLEDNVTQCLASV